MELDPNFRSQYCYIYRNRLEALKPEVLKQASDYCAEKKLRIMDKLTRICPDDECFTVGIFYMDGLYRPSILKDTMAENSFKENEPPEYKWKETTIYLEDDSYRLRLLIGDKNPGLISGIIMGVHCICTHNEELIVKKIFFPSTPIQRPIPNGLSENFLFISGLNFDYSDAESVFKCQLLFDWIDDCLEKENITEVVFVGNLFAAQKVLVEGKYGKPPVFEISQFNKLSDLLKRLCDSKKRIHITPGPNDPTNNYMPQRSIDKRFFSSLEKNNLLQTYSNPEIINIKDFYILCISHQLFDSMKIYFDNESIIETMKKVIIWSHMVPISPDTLVCYPYEDSDPFIITELPHIYVAATRNSFEEEAIVLENGKTVYCAALPEYSERNEFFVFNTESKKFRKIKIEA
eukprot:GHVP01002916.1.p1 GENE.GHVP01002916.1~~GHVP01002916.1.p1  ORF type:complete len:404 (+),score=70.71 GHVP01002916.1:333-1544(+)